MKALRLSTYTHGYLSNRKGITLIALIITIVVMLILAAVTLSMTLGEDGVIARAQYAKEEQRGVTVEERRDLWKSSIQTYELSNNSATEPQELEELLDDLLSEKNITEVEKQQIMDYGYVTIGSRTILFDERTNMSLIGYYADIERDGTVDGIIYTDFRFNNENEDTDKEYKKYYISQKNYSGPLGTADVVCPFEGTTGDNRFYIMALENVGDGEYRNFAKTLGSAYSNTALKDVRYNGNGIYKTQKMLEYWNSLDDIGIEDLWGEIQKEEYGYNLVSEEGGIWFVPTRDDMIKFGDLLTNKNQRIPEGSYWTSSLDFADLMDNLYQYRAYTAYFYSRSHSKAFLHADTIISIGSNIERKIRLSATF